MICYMCYCEITTINLVDIYHLNSCGEDFKNILLSHFTPTFFFNFLTFSHQLMNLAYSLLKIFFNDMHIRNIYKPENGPFQEFFTMNTSI